MSVKSTFFKRLCFALLIGVFAARVTGGKSMQIRGKEDASASQAPQAALSAYLPVLMNSSPWLNPFGIESTQPMFSGGTLITRASDLHLGWVRVNMRISWRELQPNPGDPIDWSELVNFENELRAIATAGLTPVVIIQDYPDWAVEIVRADGKPAACGPIAADRFTAFAGFLQAVAAHFMAPEFNVHTWELGNEPDVDPDLVNVDSEYGCWGNTADPFYGGKHYGEMLKVVAPAIRAIDSTARIWIGGLLLDKPSTTDPNKGHPELFLKGILEAGAAPYFDAVPYHWYTHYAQVKKDYDLFNGTDWQALGGGTLGKANYLRQVMQPYGVSKHLYLNESGLTCPSDLLAFPWCNPPQGPGQAFYQAQADHLVRSYLRGLNGGISGFMWYTLNGPGWRYSGLLEPDGTPKAAYLAYQQLTSQLYKTHLAGKVNYGTQVEAYAFRRINQVVHVIWTIADTSVQIPIPETKFVAAYSRDGVQIALTPVNGVVQIPANFSPTYVVMNP